MRTVYLLTVSQHALHGGCIPVWTEQGGCVSKHALGGGCLPWGCLPRGRCLFRGLSAQQGCLPRGCLPSRGVCQGVSARVCLPSRGVCQGVSARGCLPGGVYPGGVCLGGRLSGGVWQDTPLWTEWQTCVKTLPCPNFVEAVKMNYFLVSSDDINMLNDNLLPWSTKSIGFR